VSFSPAARGCVLHVDVIIKALLGHRAEIEGMMAIIVKGDALNQDDLKKAFDQIEEVDAVVSTIGGTPADPSADSQASLVTALH
jgi:hypothetical protein